MNAKWMAMAIPFLRLLSRHRKAQHPPPQPLTRAQIEDAKRLKFRQLVRHVAQHSPYYADIIRERGLDVETCTPSDFPVLTKSLLMQNFDRIVTDRRVTKQIVAEFLARSKDPNELLFDRYRVLHTSGSSGEIGYFLYSPEAWMRGMSQGPGQSIGQSGPRPSIRRLTFKRFRLAYYAAIGGHFAGVSIISARRRGLARLFINVKLFEINSPLPQVIEELNRFQPNAVTGYTIGLKVLAAKQTAGELKIAPLVIGTVGETMTKADKAMLESAFGCRASNSYGSSEHLVMGIANPDGQTMILFDRELIYEMFDDHTLVTNLFNDTVPLIRYHMSDVLRPVAHPNPRLPYLVINSLVGRTEKVPTFVNRDGAEDFLHPISIVELFIPGVMRFQMRLVDKTSFRFVVMLDPGLTADGRSNAIAATKQRLRQFLDQKLMQNVTFEVVVVHDIPPDTQSRKFKLIVEDRAS